MISIRNLDPKLVIGFVLGAIALLIMGAAAWNLGEPRWLNCLISLFGGLLGIAFCRGVLFTFFGRRYVGTGT